MRELLLPFLLMAIGFVQQSATNDSSGTAIATAAMGSAVGAGDCIVAVVEVFAATPPNFIGSITDNGGNTWPISATTRLYDNNAGGHGCEIWVLPGAAAKSGYIMTVHWTTGISEGRVTALDFSGVATGIAVDTSGTAATANGGANVTSLAVSTAQAISNGGVCLVTNGCFATGSGASGLAVPSGMNQIEIDQNDSTSICAGSAYQILSGASGIQTRTWTWTTNSTNSTTAGIVALLPASSGPGQILMGGMCL